MKQYNNIIVPTDGSVNSKRALEHAVVIASSLGRYDYAGLCCQHRLGHLEF